MRISDWSSDVCSSDPHWKLRLDYAGRSRGNQADMAKDTSPFVVGEYWLDKRRDGKAGNVWQIARSSAESRSIIYRSTKRGDLEDAKGVLLAFVNQERAKGRQTAEEADRKEKGMNSSH